MFEDGCFTGPDGDPVVEYWKEIGPGYWLSNLGRIYSFKSKKILASGKNIAQKYPSARLSFGSKEKSKLVGIHRVLAEEFIPNPNNDPVVRHLDDDPDNYELENLEWGTSKDNWNDALNNDKVHILSKEDQKKSYNIRRRPVRITNKQTGEVNDYPSLQEAGRAIGHDGAYVYIYLTKNHVHSLYDFEFIDKEVI